jgi:hypothetical protein
MAAASLEDWTQVWAILYRMCWVVELIHKQ